MKQVIPLLFLFFFILSSLAVDPLSAQDTTVLVVEISGTIDQSRWELFQEAIRQAESIEVEAVVLTLDTPGGGLQETFDIADAIQESSIPVLGYVYPRGSPAWSAGTFILISTHIAAMAPNTIIGSAQPVQLGFDGTTLVNDTKTINALVEWLQERARLYNRNASIVSRFITENLNMNEIEALQEEVIEVVATSVGDLLNQVDGTVVQTSQGNKTLLTAGAELVDFSPSIKIQVIQVLSNPVLTSLLLILGILALFIGLQSPGFGAEVFGVIAIMLSLLGSGFGISTLGIIFLSLGVLLLAIEVFVIPGFGFVGIGGLISLIIGSIFLIPTYPSHEWLISMDYIQEALIVVVVAAVLAVVFFGFLLYKFLQIRKKKTEMGVFVGEIAITIDRITPDAPGYVRYKGEYWQATSDEIIEPKTKVVIIEKQEAMLVVKPKTTKTTP